MIGANYVLIPKLEAVRRENCIKAKWRGRRAADFGPPKMRLHSLAVSPLLVPNPGRSLTVGVMTGFKF
jgi:hypothetical protein